jgi:phosphoglucomutase
LNYKEKYNFWINNSYFDSDTISELKNISEDEQEIKERFMYDLEFGTGGMRGIIGAGTNRMNKYMIRKVTQGLANYINKNIQKEKSVAIAYDPRLFSKEFANEAACVLNANSIKTFVFSELAPTPVLSFAVRFLKCTAGIVITASHNPKDYNGYKVYWTDGAQISPPIDQEIINCVNEVNSFDEIKIIDKNNKFFFTTPESVIENYIAEVKKRRLNSVDDSDLKIVYTPLNGAGNKFVRRILLETGFKNLFVVKEQELPDPEFTTVGIPNPEYKSAFKLAIKLADKENADLVLASDPDSDRLGVVVKNNGDYKYLTGNEVGILLTEYILSNIKINKTPVVISTIVSTSMIKLIAEKYNAKYLAVLTGFKYICHEIKKLEENKENNFEFVFGFEESYGYLSGTYTRDKDAVVAAMLVCEMANYYHKNNMTLVDALEKIYKTYGYQKEILESIELKGIDGINKIKNVMSFLRNNNSKNICDIEIKYISDYKLSVVKKTNGDVLNKIELPKSDVIKFNLIDNSWLCVRPSGTEPKLKIYLGVTGNDQKEVDIKSKSMLEKFKNLILLEVS